MATVATGAQDSQVKQAQSRQDTPFDYVIVGSGAGGGPLAARLALAGKRVLVIESGADPAATRPAAVAAGASPAAAQPAAQPPKFDPQDPASWREVYKVPVYYAAASEDPQMGWEFSVRHFESDAEQAEDAKYDPGKDPSHTRTGPGKGGIFYPRCSALGGCTAHHAMIIVKPNDLDWNRIAGLTGDESWRAETMQGYFPRLERCLYYNEYDSVAARLLGLLYAGLRSLVKLINPRLVLDTGQHGTAGWQTTSFIGPPLIDRILRGDFTFVRLLLGALRFELGQKGVLGRFLRAFVRFQWLQVLDPNFTSADGPGPRSVFLIPLGTDGSRRNGLREHLLRVAALHPDRLTLLTGAHATRVVFAAGAAGAPPRAVGVEVARGEDLYAASPRYTSGPPPGREVYYARAEVILSGGTFNTPQLLMLSGIGDAQHLAGMGIDGLHDAAGDKVAGVVDLPGVGCNMQDRYEVSVISRTSKEFSVLHNASFLPGDPNDPARLEWLKTGGGLYATNGGSLALFITSGQQPPGTAIPDVFVFGVPAAFRGYYWNWSRELLRSAIGAPSVERDLWSWVILKAYTHNNGGTVRLRSSSPFAQPEIEFHSFGPAGSASDLDALVAAVGHMREINRANAVITEEIQPGSNLPDGSPALRDWLRTQTWGHHACGTCRMGADTWRANVADLCDRSAVIDSRFRVHGVQGLRVVDASVFPYIPGYFIVTPIFMVAEKAADSLIADSALYPRALAEAEAAAVHERRNAARPSPASPGAPQDAQALPADAVGLALSGGGIRSATYALGVLQALAGKRRLRQIDFLSTVSGGGYIGAFLGRLFTRVEAAVADKVERVEEIVRDLRSAQMWWLRQHANYIAGGGRADLEAGLGVVWRNLLAVQLVVGLLLVAALGALRWIAWRYWAAGGDPVLGGVVLSPWWPLPAAELLLGLAPAWLGFWLSPKPGSRRSLSPSTLPVWLVLLALAVAALGRASTLGAGLVALGVLLLAWLWQEAAGWNLPAGTSAADLGIAVRNRLTRAAGGLLLLFLASALWVGLDTLAGWVAGTSLEPMAYGGAVLAAAMTALTNPLVARLPARGGRRRQPAAGRSYGPLLAVLTFGLVFTLVLGCDILMHSLSSHHPPTVLQWVTLAALALSVSIGPAIGFVNLSSWCGAYAARLSRTFLGASNEARLHPGLAAPASLAVQVSHPADDVPLGEYHPERNGGPLHLLNVCVTQTVDFASGRQLASDRSLPMCVGPLGISVGERYHALWAGTAVRALPVGPDPQAFHVLAKGSAPVGSSAVEVESLRLSEWMAISGAALAPGAGKHTKLWLSLLLGLFNVRLGYWWNSGISAGQRPGRYPPTFWQRLKGAPGWVLRAQSMLLNEWRGYFRGPSERFWYLSDGGNFESSGLYELIRRRLPFMVAIDAGHDPDYRCESFAAIERLARIELGTQIDWLDPDAARRSGAGGWNAFAAGAPATPVPDWIRDWINPEAVGSLWEIGRGAPTCAALARITYGGSAPASWLLVLKAAVTDAAPFDVREFAAQEPTFPNRPTPDQFLGDDEWESYRRLGESAADHLFLEA
jgi:choline dehydrogenase-like flavoprotein